MVEVGRVRLRAGRRALIGGDRRVAHRERDARERHVELFGHELHLRGEEALSQLALAGVGQHAAVSGYGDPPIERGGAAAVDPLRQQRRLEAVARGAEGHDQRARPLQEAAPGEAGRAERAARVGREPRRHARLAAA